LKGVASRGKVRGFRRSYRGGDTVPGVL